MFGIIITPPRSAQPHPLTAGRKRPHKGERERPPPRPPAQTPGKVPTGFAPTPRTSPGTAPRRLPEHRMRRRVPALVQTERHFSKYLSPLFLPPQKKVQGETPQERQSAPRTHPPGEGAAGLRHAYLKGAAEPTRSVLRQRQALPRRRLRSASGRRAWGSSAFPLTSHGHAATKAHGPWRRIRKAHQRQRHETAKLPVSTPPKPPKRRARRPGDSSEGADSPRAAGRGFLPGARGAAAPPRGVPKRAHCSRLSRARPRSELRAPGAVAHLPAPLPPAAGARGPPTATLLSAPLPARDLGSRPRAAPSPAAAVLSLLRCARAPAPHVSCAARFPSSPGRRRPPHPPARGRASRLRRTLPAAPRAASRAPCRPSSLLPRPARAPAALPSRPRPRPMSGGAAPAQSLYREGRRRRWGGGQGGAPSGSAARLVPRGAERRALPGGGRGAGPTPSGSERRSGDSIPPPEFERPRTRPPLE